MAAVLAAVVRVILLAYHLRFDIGIVRATRLIPLVFDRWRNTPSSTVRIYIPFFRLVLIRLNIRQSILRSCLRL
jgi:hypothetical protein